MEEHDEDEEPCVETVDNLGTSSFSPETSVAVTSPQSPSPKNKPGPYQRKVEKRKNKDSGFLESIAKSMSEPITISNPQPEDEDDIFGNYVAAKLKTLPKMCKVHLIHKINEAIFEAEVESEGYPHTNSYMSLLSRN